MFIFAFDSTKFYEDVLRKRELYIHEKVALDRLESDD
jgi:hypothetical protein